MPITHREAFYKRYNIPKDKSLSIEEIARIARVPVEALKEIESRGRGAWSTNIRSVRLLNTFDKNPNLKAFPRSARLSTSQWAFARIFSFLDKGKTYKTADKDIAEKYNI